MWYVFSRTCPRVQTRRGRRLNGARRTQQEKQLPAPDAGGRPPLGLGDPTPPHPAPPHATPRCPIRSALNPHRVAEVGVLRECHLDAEAAGRLLLLLLVLARRLSFLLLLRPHLGLQRLALGPGRGAARRAQGWGLCGQRAAAARPRRDQGATQRTPPRAPNRALLSPPLGPAARASP
jgi:hypothetical protein